MKVKEKYMNFYYDTIGEIPDPVIDPKKTALLIVDMQNQFILRDSPEAEAFKAAGEWEKWIPFHDRLDEIVVPNAVKILETFRKYGMLVTYARIACQRDDGEDRSPVQKSEGWNNIFLPAGNPETQIIDQLAPMKNELVFDKTTDSVTTGTNYLTIMRYMGIERVVVAGIVTDQCVACTVRGLADAGLKVIVCEDACAAGNMEQHDAELKIMNFIYCDVLSTDETIELIDRAAESEGEQ